MVNSSSHEWLILNLLPNLINYYTTIVKGMLLKEEYTTIENCTLLMDTKKFLPYPTMFLGQHSQPNPTHIEYTTIVAENFLHNIDQYPTIYDFLAIAPKEISHWNYYLMYPNKCAKLKIFQPTVGKNIGQQYCWCSLMWLMPLRSLSNCDYELKNLPRLILGPIHSNQVMGTDPVGSHHGTRNSRSNSINPTYPYQ